MDNIYHLLSLIYNKSTTTFVSLLPWLGINLTNNT